jgi:2-polyprenyl-6-methoxyphenol hydroxylase-like FAD-dependent oxidoreductase
MRPYRIALLDLAREAGATVRMGARPTDLARCESGWHATLPDGEALEARLLVGADAFIGIVGNSHSPGRGLARIAASALDF